MSLLLENRHKALEILSLAFQITANTDFAVWVEWAGHVENISIRIGKKGTTKKLFEKNCWIQSKGEFKDNRNSEANKILNEALEFLKALQ